MKSFLALILFLSFLQINSQTSVSQSEIDKNAKQAVASFFLIDCLKGRSFSWSLDDGLLNTNNLGFEIWEFNNLEWHPKSININEAEKNEGFQWKGDITIKSKKYRHFSVCGTNTSIVDDSKYCGKWEEWKDFNLVPFVIHLYKKNNKWGYSTVDSPSYQVTLYSSQAPDCNYIKQMAIKK